MLDFVIKNTDLILNKAITQIWKIKQYRYESILRPDHGFLYLFSGNATYTFDDCKIELKSGDILYLPKNSRYVVNFDLSNGTVEDHLINFDVAVEAEFTDIKKPMRVINDRTGTLLDCFKDVVNAYSEKDKPFLVNSYFYLCLNSLQTAMQYENSEPDRLKFEKAARMLAEDFELSVDGIAKEMYMSRSSFQKKFIRYFGMSPIEYRTKKRLKKAKLLLENTDIPIKEISDSLAFYDIAYFYKAFKREYGFTPNAYREIKKTFFSAAIY